MTLSVRYSRYSPASRSFSKVKNSVICAEFSTGHIFKLWKMNENPCFFKYLSMKITLQWAQNSIFLMENSFSPIYFHWQILGIQRNSWCLVWNVSSFILCKFPSLFSTAKLNLGHRFSQFTLRFELGFLDVGLRLYFKLCPNSRGD